MSTRLIVFILLFVGRSGFAQAIENNTLREADPQNEIKTSFPDALALVSPRGLSTEDSSMTDKQGMIGYCEVLETSLLQEVSGHRDCPERQLPDAPSAQSSSQQKWDLDTPVLSTPVLSPQARIWDKKMWAAHMVLAGSMVFDAEVTHQGLAHHRCVEGNIDIGEHPSRKALYLDDLVQFLPATLLFDWFIGGVGGRASHANRWLSQPLKFEGALIGSVVHIRGGIQWFTHDCM